VLHKQNGGHVKNATPQLHKNWHLTTHQIIYTRAVHALYSTNNLFR